MVTGGWSYGVYGTYGCLDSTEIYESNTESWRLVDKLPKPMNGLRASSIDGKVLIFGKKLKHNKWC